MENKKSITIIIMIIITIIIALKFNSMAMAGEQVAPVKGDITLTPTGSGKVTLTPTSGKVPLTATSPGRITATTRPGQRVTKTPYYPPDRVVPGGDGNLEPIIFFVGLAGILFTRLVVHILQGNSIKR